MNQLHIHLSKFIEATDIFGQGVGIRYDRKQFHKTKLGGLATIVIWGLLCFQAQTIIEELILQQNPTVIQQINYVYQPDAFRITPKQFVMMIGLQDDKFNHFYGEGIYILKVYQNIQTRDNNTINGVGNQQSAQIEIQSERCTPDHFQIQESKEYFMILPYQEMHCISLSQQPPYIEGEFSAEKYASIEFQFHQCQNSGCKDQTEIDALLIKPTLAIYLSDSFINIKQKQNPFQSTGKNLFWTTGPSMEKQIFLSLINSKIESDYSIFGTSNDNLQRVVYSSDREITLPRTSDQLFGLTVVYEKNKEAIQFRKYLKVGNAFSQVGGLFNFLVTIGFLFFRKFSQDDLNHKLINEVFDIRDDITCKQFFQNKDETKSQGNILQTESINVQLKQYQSHKKQQKNCDQNENFMNNSTTKTPCFKENKQKIESNLFVNENINLQNQTQKEEEKKQQQYQNQKQAGIKQISFNLWNYIINVWRCCKCCKTTQSNLIQYATNTIFDHIDLFNVIKKLIEVDKLKQLLLNEDQIKLFEYLPKPILFMSHYQSQPSEEHSSPDMNGLKESTFKLPNKQYDKKLSFDQLKGSYLNIIKKRYKSVIDLKIMSMLDPKIKQKLTQEECSQTNSPLLAPVSTSLIKPKSMFNNQQNDEYEDSISRIDDLNDIFKPRNIKSTHMKSMIKLKKDSFIIKQGFAQCESILDESKTQQ